MEQEFDWAEWIKFERLLRGWSQNEMAKRALVSGWQNTLNRIEAKKIGVTFRTLVLVAPVFGFSPEEVMKLAEIPYRKPTIINKVNKYSEIGKIIKARRENLGITEEEIGEQMNLALLTVINRALDINTMQP